MAMKNGDIWFRVAGHGIDETCSREDEEGEQIGFVDVYDTDVYDTEFCVNTDFELYFDDDDGFEWRTTR